MTVAVARADDKPSVRAAVLLWALKLCKQLELDGLPTTASEAIACAGAGRSQAYEVLARLEASVVDLFEAAGRPNAPALAPDKAVELSTAVCDFLIEHPGAVTKTASRHHFHDSFSIFVVGLFGPGGAAHGLSVEKAAQALRVPLGTLKGWLSAPPKAAPSPKPPLLPPTVPVTVPELATIQFEYANWQGTMSDFCSYVRDELGMSYGRSYITSILILSGQHRPRPRNVNVPAPWSRGTYQTLFPGVQWLGDGTLLKLEINGVVFPFNLEAMVDTASNAIVGIHISKSEDTDAVRQAYQAGLVSTEGQCPLSLMLDNKPCNHGPRVEQSCPGATILHSTRGRGQAKAAVEGAFGLLQQECPELVIRGDTVDDIARDMLRLVVTAWGVGRNGRPRRKLGGLSPTQLYQTFSASTEDLDKAHKLILQLKDKEERAAQTRKRHTDPARLAILRDCLRELGIDDPDDRIAVGLARYSLHAILQGLATFKYLLAADKVPPDAELHRYLGGIIRNADNQARLESIADELLERRLQHSALLRKPLIEERQTLVDSLSPDLLPTALLKLALRSQTLFAHRYWVARAVEALSLLGPSEATSLYQHLSRLVAAHHSVPLDRRENIISRLATAVSLARAAA